jgi:Spy/CpxP family protein refolding chaperone
MRAQMQAQMHGPNATPADRSAHFEAMSKFRDEQLAARSAALKDLYAVLTPEQKLIADQRLMPGHGPGMAWRAPAN